MSFHVIGPEKQHPSTVLFRERTPKRSSRHQFNLYIVGLWVVVMVVSYLLVKEIV